jgi:peptide/nickel transport system permease protein
MAGLSVVVAFAIIGILAPLISPYSRNFEAPDSDRFTVSDYPRALPTNLTYGPPVMGPTTPLSSDRQGGMWLINYARQGFIFMDFLEHTLESNLTPFQAGNLSLRFDITQDFSFPLRAPRPSAPLTALYYIVPAQDSSKSRGPGRENGAIAFFAQRDFFVIDPFSKSLIFWARLNFDPIWTGEDPASAGEMFVLPVEFNIRPFPGVPGRDVGPFRYFYASDLNHTALFEVTYVHSADPATPRGQLVLLNNESLTAPPFVYYNQDNVDIGDDYRSGVGQAFFLPLANGTLEVHNVTGRTRQWVPLTLDGLPATVAGPIGFTRSTFPLWLYVPLRSSQRFGVGIFEVTALRLIRSFSLPNPSLQILGAPTSYRGKASYFGLYDPNAGSGGTTHMVGFNDTAAEITQFRADFPGRVRWTFEVSERSKVFVFTSSGELWMQSTVFRTEAGVLPEKFAIQPPPTTTSVRYAGALGGTLYGSALIPQELYGVWTDPVVGQTDVFQLLGTVRTPLPPGAYPSGNRYILGTDFRGGDILTQLFYGTQVAFIVGGLAAIFAVGIGTLVGLIAGYYGRIVDTLLMRTTDIFLVLPFLPIVLILAAILRPSIWVIILVLGVVGWPGIARVIRAQVLTLKERPFIDAARVSGASDLRLLFFQIAPNVLPFSFLYMSLTVAGAIITEAALSFLGLGDVTVISWGGMLSQVLTFGGALTAWWWLLPPGLAITLLSLGFYLLGRGFDEIINPRLRRR